ncbi:thymidylate synthase [Pseudomonas phage phiK7A1]|uniref:Thymidylate synthase n=1 Tax=Pseudomonas phage phiK7A1 TaxID=2759194 RepID=A0A7H0XFX4_9CAUD|nr:thymidylate synthase [Pseudomonas phage phiK7A1]
MSQIKVELIDHMGSDLAVVNAARVSFAKESQQFVEQDIKLINYLATHDHWTPFAHTALQFRVAAPVPIRTQCFKHKVGLVENEESRRYISTVPEIYIPEFFRSKPEGSIKQGSADKHEDSDFWLQRYVSYTGGAVQLYMMMLEAGICPEQARFVLPQGAIVNWIWTGNLIAFANFYNKRTDNHAQKEVQDVALILGPLVEQLFPVSWKALTGGNK